MRHPSKRAAVTGLAAVAIVLVASGPSRAWESGYADHGGHYGHAGVGQYSQYYGPPNYGDSQMGRNYYTPRYDYEYVVPYYSGYAGHHDYYGAPAYGYGRGSWYDGD